MKAICSERVLLRKLTALKILSYYVFILYFIYIFSSPLLTIGPLHICYGFQFGFYKTPEYASEILFLVPFLGLFLSVCFVQVLCVSFCFILL